MYLYACIFINYRYTIAILYIYPPTLGWRVGHLGGLTSPFPLLHLARATAGTKGGRYPEPFVLLEPPAQNPGCCCVAAEPYSSGAFFRVERFSAQNFWTALDPLDPPLKPPAPPPLFNRFFALMPFHSPRTSRQFQGGPPLNPPRQPWTSWTPRPSNALDRVL